MKDKNSFQKNKQAQLDEWKAEIAKLKVRSSKAGADMQLKMNEHIKLLERKAEDAGAKLAVLAKTSKDAWGSIKEGVESVWSSLKSDISNASAKFK